MIKFKTLSAFLPTKGPFWAVYPENKNDFKFNVTYKKRPSK